MSSSRKREARSSVQDRTKQRQNSEKASAGNNSATSTGNRDGTIVGRKGDRVIIALETGVVSAHSRHRLGETLMWCQQHVAVKDEQMASFKKSRAKSRPPSYESEEMRLFDKVTVALTSTPSERFLH